MRYAPPVHVLAQDDASWVYVPTSSMKPCKAPVSNKRLKSSAKRMRCALRLKAHFRRRCVVVGCGVHVILARRRRTSTRGGVYCTQLKSRRGSRNLARSHYYSVIDTGVLTPGGVQTEMAARAVRKPRRRTFKLDLKPGAAHSDLVIYGGATPIFLQQYLTPPKAL